MTLTVSIEVAVPTETSNTDRGRVLEKFARRLLETQNYKVTEEVRISGAEVDLLAIEKKTGEQIFVECKAHRSTISAEVVHKLFGIVKIKRIAAGWLISTFELGKDAKGLRHDWEQRPPAERRQLQIYDPQALIERLVGAKVIVAPEQLAKPHGLRYADEAYLLLLRSGEFWAILVLDPQTGIRQAALLFNATTGTRVTSEAVLTEVAATDTTLASLNFSPDTSSNAEKETERLNAELQSIVRVPIAEHWADYRPARPEDFVGRDDLQKNVFDFFDKIRAGQSRTRLFAIKAPSGWGKSSCVLKIGARAENRRNKCRIFVFAVDSRAATSKRFGEFALFTAMKKAVEAKFVGAPANFTFGGAHNPFATDAMKEILSSLKREKKLLCLIFDQFEELLYKSEMEPVFDEIRAVCNAVDEAQEYIVIGFSWKTDGTIPSEHKAYHLWHSLADRRLEFELAPFSANEVTTALNRFAQELGQPLVPQLRRLLQDHCQGYPWLLKKLCIHILDMIRSGMEQGDVLVRSLSIQELFRKDIERLSQTEHACIQEISRDAPAEFFKVVNTYGDEVVNRLLDKRLIIRSGLRLSIYWDIFRDYVLTERIPYIPINYVPQAHFTTYWRTVRFLLREREVTYDALAQELRLAKSTVDNIVRDLVMVGHAEANRKEEVVNSLHQREDEAVRVMVEYCMSHVLYRAFIGEFGPGISFSEGVAQSLAKRVLMTPSLSDQLVEHYCQKLLRWFLAAGLIEREGRGYVLRQRPSLVDLSGAGAITNLRRGPNLFLAEAPPRRAIDALRDALAVPTSRKDLEARHGRNSFSVLVSLGLFHPNGEVALRTDQLTGNPEDNLRAAASRMPTVQFVQELLARRPRLDSAHIGQEVRLHFACEWSVASKRRYGNALKQWALWASGRKLRRDERAHRQRSTPTMDQARDLFA